MPRLTPLRALGSVLLLILIALVVLWLARKPIADEAIRRELKARGIDASYTVKTIGLQWERIENVRIGDPRAPDLTADWAEIRVSAGFSGLAFRAVRAGGVRLHGRIVDGRLTLGQIDRLLPKSDGKTPFSLPDLDVEVSDARMRLDSVNGAIGARVDGKGNLADGFAGKLAVIAPFFKNGSCQIDGLTAYVDLSVRARQPTISGPVRVDAFRCAAAHISKSVLAANVTLAPTLDRWRGRATVKANGLATQGAVLATLDGRVTFDGSLTDTRGTAALTAQAARYGTTRIAGLSVEGNFAIARGLRGEGTVHAARLLTDSSVVQRLEAAARRASATPVGPVLAQLGTALRQALNGVAVDAAVRFADASATISRLTATSAGGAVFKAAGGSGLRVGTAGFLVDTQLSLSGGGFPTGRATLQRRADGVTLGIAQIDPIVTGGARLAFDRIRYAANGAAAMRVETVATLDGPLGDGRVQGLRLPVNATLSPNGNAIINNGCTPVALRALSVSGLILNESVLRLCPAQGNALLRLVQGRLSGGAVVNAPRLNGRLGSTPLDLTAASARLMLGSNGFGVEQLAARLGGGDRVSRLDIGALTGRFGAGDIQGRFSQTSGKLGAVPLFIDGGDGDWTFRNGTLMVQGKLRVSDEAVPGRFNPLVTDDAILKLVDSRIAATATLREPATRTEVTKVVIAHNLKTGTGDATLQVSSLRFGKALQPEALTRLTLGVIANLEGAVAGQGSIRWTPQGVNSTGRFATDGLNFAAAFGPVTGLKGAIIFDDLLALATPPGQTVIIASINPGTLVSDGVIRYQLLAGQRVAVESGTWPFAGGQLLLDPTTLDMGTASDRNLTFRVVALDAAKFIQQLEFDNLAATGIFDGVLPMTFDANGGRIGGGHLIVRKGGGTLAYVGEVSNAQMNVFAKIAFDALKSIRYNKLTIDLDGPLDGEIVSQIRFDGINEAPLSPPKSFLARQFIGLPFVFNIKVQAPFRGLLNTARTIQDPSSLLQRTIPEIRKPPVQPPSSESRR